MTYEIFIQNLKKLNHSILALENRQFKLEYEQTFLSGKNLNELISLKKEINELKITIKKLNLLMKKTKKEFNLKYDKVTEEMIPFLKKHIYEIHLPPPSYDRLFSEHIIFVYQLIQKKKESLLKMRPMDFLIIQRTLEEFGVGLQFGTCFSKNEIEEKLFSDENFKRKFEYQEYQNFIFLLADGYSPRTR